MDELIRLFQADHRRYETILGEIRPPALEFAARKQQSLFRQVVEALDGVAQAGVDMSTTLRAQIDSLANGEYRADVTAQVEAMFRAGEQEIHSAIFRSDVHSDEGQERLLLGCSRFADLLESAVRQSLANSRILWLRLRELRTPDLTVVRESVKLRDSLAANHPELATRIDRGVQALKSTDEFLARADDLIDRTLRISRRTSLRLLSALLSVLRIPGAKQAQAQFRFYRILTEGTIDLAFHYMIHAVQPEATWAGPFAGSAVSSQFVEERLKAKRSKAIGAAIRGVEPLLIYAVPMGVALFGSVYYDWIYWRGELEAKVS
ncbi:MAG: hypothetical protein ACJ8GN_19950 [Longimicrobiaceae bacterium]